MAAMKLNDGLSLLIQPDNKKLRLVVTDGITELACRKETSGKLAQLLSSEKGVTLFKGRLQLHKNEDFIAVILKGNVLGTVSKADLKTALGTL